MKKVLHADVLTQGVGQAKKLAFLVAQRRRCHLASEARVAPQSYTSREENANLTPFIFELKGGNAFLQSSFQNKLKSGQHKKEVPTLSTYCALQGLR